VTKKTALLAFGGLAKLLLASLAYGAQPTWETYFCEYFDLKGNVMLTGRCHKELTKINGHFGYMMKWPSGNSVTVEYLASQSGDHIWRLNRKPAVGIEINRDHLKGFTLDLNQLIEWEDRQFQ
jgi:hypothetical protein